ncbi:hypothetical protein [Escherichia coli]|uniref:hypothetical protein n=1 Tax=Escherichia coli TaxID=562 RepID=UPI00397508B5
MWRKLSLAWAWLTVVAESNGHKACEKSAVSTNGGAQPPRSLHRDNDAIAGAMNEHAGNY